MPSASLLISRIPLLGEFTCQNAIMAERFIEAGSAYVSRKFSSILCDLKPLLSTKMPAYDLIYLDVRYTLCYCVFTNKEHVHGSYALKLEKADVYRLPYLSSSGPGFGL